MWERSWRFQVAGVPRARSGPRDGLGPDAAVQAPHAPQLALDKAPAGAEIEVAPALDPTAVDVPGELPAATAHPPAAFEPDGHDHPHGAELDAVTDAPGRRSKRLNAVVTRIGPSSRVA